MRLQLAAVLPGLVVSEVTVSGFARFAPASDTVGCRVVAVRRRGKFLLFELLPADGDVVELVVSLGMTGQLLWHPPPPSSGDSGGSGASRDSASVPAGRGHVQVVWHFADGDGPSVAGVLVLRDPRRFSRVLVTEPGRYASSSLLARLGPEPLEPGFDAPRAAGVVASMSVRSPVKAVLLSQRPVAGVGNYLADEALFAAGVHPAARRLSPAVAARVVTALVGTMRASLAAGGVSMRDYVHVDGSTGSFADCLRVYGRAGQGCVVCGTVLSKVTVAQRSSTFCPTCQSLSGV